MKTILFLTLIASTAFGGAKLMWDNPNAAGTVGRYIVYHSRAVSGNFTNYSETVTNELALGPLRSGPNFFYVTAVGTNAFESDPSNQVLVPVANPPQGTRIVITTP